MPLLIYTDNAAGFNKASGMIEKTIKDKESNMYTNMNKRNVYILSSI
jgi:hypothetical protein